MVRQSPPLRYIITSHGWLEGCTLSLAGQWGNLPFVDQKLAQKFAHDYANGRAYQIERKHNARVARLECNP